MGGKRHESNVNSNLLSVDIPNLILYDVVFQKLGDGTVYGIGIIIVVSCCFC